MLALISLIAGCVLPVLGQRLSFGVMAGVPLNYSAPSPCCSIQNYTDESSPYTVGPSVEFRLPAGFAIELDALYRRLGLRDSGLTAFTSYDAFTERWRGNAWEFTLLGKYYLRKRERWQPFVGAGIGMRYLTREAHGSHVGALGSFYESRYSDNQFIAGETAPPESVFARDASTGCRISLHSLERIGNPDRIERGQNPCRHCLLSASYPAHFAATALNAAKDLS